MKYSFIPTIITTAILAVNVYAETGHELYGDECAEAINKVGNNNVININTAKDYELSAYLHKIGPKMAQRIITYRETNGEFNSLESLKGVSGIGDKVVALNKCLVYFCEDSDGNALINCEK